ncbi:hypothetical protein RJ641_003565 [Dillenia turbinata]|uniref:Uncharacterized protein n=1 Tax=Dillenia turbinata TaxID=194707 RepID=A0AAN8ZBI9_9MAGN
MKKKGDVDEVEELLKVAEEEMLLKLSVDSHMSRVSPSYLDSDLDRRFHALKSSSSSSTIKLPDRNPSSTSTGQKKKSNDDDVDELLNADLAARFAVLKGQSKPTSFDDPIHNSGMENHEGDDDEVEKIIKWAIDAARLDPSPPTDDEDNNDEDDDDDDDEENDQFGKSRQHR